MGSSQEPAKRKRAEVVKRQKKESPGCILNTLGILSIIVGAVLWSTWFVPAILLPFGLWVLLRGGKMSWWWECGECGTRLPNPNANRCPACGYELN
jgi:hypothetical protein